MAQYLILPVISDFYEINGHLHCLIVMVTHQRDFIPRMHLQVKAQLELVYCA